MTRQDRQRDGPLKLGKYKRMLAFMEEERNRMVPAWREISRFICPNRGYFDQEEPNRGARTTSHLLDATAARALGTLQAGMQGGLTSPSVAWFKLQVSDPALADIPSVMRWTDEVQELILAAFGKSNVYNCLHGAYGEIGAFGIGAIFLEEDEDTVLRGTLLTAGEYCASFDERALPCAFGRAFYMTARQMEGAFGREVLGEDVRQALDGGSPDRWYKVCHLISVDNEGLTPHPWASIYWREGRDEPLRVRGYEDFPVVIPRWETVACDTYGYGPGWAAVGETKTLQEMARDKLIAIKMMIQPPIVAPTSARNERMQFVPGAINYTDSDAAARPAYQVNLDLNAISQGIQESQEKILKAFYADLFLNMLALNDKDMTATEASIRRQERMQMLGPVEERLEHELLNPIVSWTFNAMLRRGMFPEPPPELAGRSIKIDYISMLAIAQRSSGMDAMSALIQTVGVLGQMAPEALDKLDADEVVNQFVRMTNVPGAVVRDDEIVAAMRQQRARQQAAERQAAEAQQAVQMAQDGAGAVRNLSAAQLQGGASALDGIVGAMRGEGGDV